MKLDYSKMDKIQKEHLNEFYEKCWWICHDNYIFYGVENPRQIENIWERAKFNSIIKNIIAYLNFFDGYVLSDEYKWKNKENELVIYSGSYFIENWNELIDEFIKNLKYFPNIKKSLTETFNELKKICFDLGCAETLLWVKTSGYGVEIFRTDEI